jgi:hypothetical protein
MTAKPKKKTAKKPAKKAPSKKTAPKPKAKASAPAKKASASAPKQDASAKVELAAEHFVSAEKFVAEVIRANDVKTKSLRLRMLAWFKSAK